MKTVLLMTIACLSAHAAQTVEVFLCNSSLCPAVEVMQAQTAVSHMFTAAGVHLHWNFSRPPKPEILQQSRPVVVKLLQSAPPSAPCNALGFAQPYEGIHVFVFYERIQMRSSGGSSTLLAHVLAHEIAHVLQEIDRHSETGIMKAHWSQADFHQMENGSLRFAEEDIALIQTGLERRAASRTRFAAADLSARR